MKVYVWNEPLASPHETLVIVAEDDKKAEIAFKKHYSIDEKVYELDDEVDWFSKNPTIIVDDTTKAETYSDYM